MPLIESGHTHFGENKVQEALEKWSEIKNEKIKLHLIGKLQTNKVKFALKIFDYIHSVDSKKLAKKIDEEENKQKKKIKIFIQVNIGNESQKSGIAKEKLLDLSEYCKELNLDVVGLMCLPPINESPIKYFQETFKLNQKLDYSELSMGMSSDYLKAIESHSTYLRIGSGIFGNRN
jgi:pyridoxal phosphate enzyme (YggS family)